MFKFYSVKNNESFQFIGFHNHLLKIDIKTKDLLENLSSYTNLEKNMRVLYYLSLYTTIVK